MDDKGNIRQLSESEVKVLSGQHFTPLEARLRRIETVITNNEADFFKTKGAAFRELWGKRLSRGLNPDQKERLDSMVQEFVEKNKD